MPTIDVVLDGMDVNSDQTIIALATTTLIRGQRNILVDVGHAGRRKLLRAVLQRKGLTPADIHGVVITHAHWDHAQNIDMFPQATMYIHPAELDYSRSPRPDDLDTQTSFPGTLQGFDVQEVVEGTELDTGVYVIETPGHSKGHISVVVETPEGPAIIGGDAFTDAATIHRGKPNFIVWSQRQAQESVRKMMELGKIFYPGHDRPFRLISPTEVEYFPDAPTSITFFGSWGLDPSYGYNTVIQLAPSKELHVLPEAQDT